MVHVDLPADEWYDTASEIFVWLKDQKIRHVADPKHEILERKDGVLHRRMVAMTYMFFNPEDAMLFKLTFG